MKRIHWWTLLGVAGVSLAATLVGQSVWGQPDSNKPVNALPLPPMAGAQPVLPVLPDLDVKQVPEMSGDPQLTIKPGPSLPGSPPPPLVGVAPAQNAPSVAQPSASPLLIPRSGETALPHTTSAKSETDPLGAPTLELRPGRQQASISLEWVGPQAVRIQQQMPCQFLVRNMSSAPVHNVVVRQRLPHGVICKASEPQAVTDAGDLVWCLGMLPPDQTRRIELQLVAQTRGILNCQATVSFTGTTTYQVHVREPQLAVKMRTPDKVVAGESVTLLFAVSNPGDGVAETVKVKAMLPEGLEHSRGKVVEVDVGNLAPKEIRTMQLVCLAKGSGPQKCMVVSTADGGITSHDAAQLEILTPKLEAAMSGPKLRYLDRHAVYLVKITNPGSAPATNVEVHEVLPAGLKFHQATHGGQYHEATRTVSWTLGDVPPGQSKEIAVDLIPIEAGEHRLVAQVKSWRALKTEAEARTVVEGLSSLLIELGDTDDPIEVGAETSYELHVTNTGTKTETNVEVICTLPEQLEFRGAKCSTTLRYRIEGRELTFEPLAKLAPKADVIYRVQVRGAAPGDVRFRTRIRADDLKEAIIREERTRIYRDDSPLRSVGTNTPNVNPVPTPNANLVLTPNVNPVPTPNVNPVPTPNVNPVPTPNVNPIPTPTPTTSSNLVLTPTSNETPTPAPTPNVTPMLPTTPTPAPTPNVTPMLPTTPTPVPTPGPLTPSAELPMSKANTTLKSSPLAVPSEAPKVGPLPVPNTLPSTGLVVTPTPLNLPATPLTINPPPLSLPTNNPVPNLPLPEPTPVPSSAPTMPDAMPPAASTPTPVPNP